MAITEPEPGAVTPRLANMDMDRTVAVKFTNMPTTKGAKPHRIRKYDLLINAGGNEYKLCARYSKVEEALSSLATPENKWPRHMRTLVFLGGTWRLDRARRGHHLCQFVECFLKQTDFDSALLELHKIMIKGHEEDGLNQPALAQVLERQRQQEEEVRQSQETAAVQRVEVEATRTIRSQGTRGRSEPTLLPNSGGNLNQQFEEASTPVVAAAQGHHLVKGARARYKAETPKLKKKVEHSEHDGKIVVVIRGTDPDGKNPGGGHFEVKLEASPTTVFGFRGKDHLELISAPAPI